MHGGHAAPARRGRPRHHRVHTARSRVFQRTRHHRHPLRRMHVAQQARACPAPAPARGPADRDRGQRGDGAAAQPGPPAGWGPARRADRDRLRRPPLGCPARSAGTAGHRRRPAITGTGGGRRPDARRRLLQLPLGSRARSHRRTGARGRRPRRHPPARRRARLSGGERGLHTHRTVCRKPGRRDRSARRRVRVFRSRDGRHRRLPHR